MARPKKSTVDYFPHVTTHGKTMFILEQRFGNDGYAVFFKTLETLGNTDGHLINCNDLNAWVFLSAYCRVEADLLRQILELLAELGAINKEFWDEGFIFCENFVDGIKDAYSRREGQLPTLKRVSAYINSIKQTMSGVNDCKNGERERERESKEKEEERNTLSVLPAKQTLPYDYILDDMNTILGTRFRLVDSFKKLVKARINEGMQVEDFSDVCRKMKSEWGSNPDMVQYLRPETLFGNKMNGYLGRVGAGKKMVSSGNQRLFEEIQEMERRELNEQSYSGQAV